MIMSMFTCPCMYQEERNTVALLLAENEALKRRAENDSLQRNMAEAKRGGRRLHDPIAFCSSSEDQIETPAAVVVRSRRLSPERLPKSAAVLPGLTQISQGPVQPPSLAVGGGAGSPRQQRRRHVNPALDNKGDLPCPALKNMSYSTNPLC